MFFKDRPNSVWNILLWIKQKNPHYKNVTIDEGGKNESLALGEIDITIHLYNHFKSKSTWVQIMITQDKGNTKTRSSLPTNEHQPLGGTE